MLTNLFGKFNPVNFIICGTYLLIAFFASFFISAQDVISAQGILVKLGIWTALVFSILLLDFLIRKNALTGPNTFGIFVFSGLVVMLPIVFTHINIILSNVFLLLALRRMVSLTSQKNIEKKLFDAAFYITIASLFNFWSVLFLVPLYWAIVRTATLSFRLFFIPVVGVLAVLVLAVTIHLLALDSLLWFTQWISTHNFDFSAYNETSILVPSAFIATLVLWTVSIRIMKFASLPRKLQYNYRLLTIVTVTSVLIIFCTPEKTGAEMLFICAPLSIVVTNYLERLNDVWFKEMLLWILVLLPIILLFL